MAAWGRWLAAALLVASVANGQAEDRRPQVRAANPVAAGAYLVIVGGCNDCHTPGWDRSPGAVARERLLTGNPVGYAGPWGVSYAANLRLYFNTMTADKWVETARTLKARPPMPNYNVMTMSEPDLRAIYAYIRSLGPTGQPAPDGLPPGSKPTAPVVVMVPQ
jgi:mono/diheme cytochrome c family protein